MSARRIDEPYPWLVITDRRLSGHGCLTG
jgi:hypothetical protein